MKRAIVTYAAGAHEELLDVALPTYHDFAVRHRYDLRVIRGNLPPSVWEIRQPAPSAWNKIPILIDAMETYEEVIWFDCDLVVVNALDDFPPMAEDKLHALVRHFEDNSEVPNTGVWRLHRSAVDLLQEALALSVFKNHGWWEQAAVMTLMGYCVPPEGHQFSDTKCRCVNPTAWYNACQFMRLEWNSHPNYRADFPRIVHCSYPSMPERIEVMRSLVKDPKYNYPRYSKPVPEGEVDD